MTHNIVETIQTTLGYSALQKVDPNSQEVKDDHHLLATEKLGQSAIPAVLAGVYKLTRTEEGCNSIVDGYDKDWLAVIFKGNEQSAVQRVASYAGVSENQAESHMENIADETIRLLKDHAGSVSASGEKIKEYMNSERHTILVHLPAALQMSDILNDGVLDDRTNKMEGPISNLMHKIENSFSSGDDK